MINIVLRHEYQGVEVSAAYEDTTDFKARRIAAPRITAGLGRMTADADPDHASYAKENPIAERGPRGHSALRDAALRYDPTFLQVPSFPTVATPPILSLRTGHRSPGLGTSSFSPRCAGYTGGGGLAPFVARAGVDECGATGWPPVLSPANRGVLQCRYLGLERLTAVPGQFLSLHPGMRARTEHLGLVFTQQSAIVCKAPQVSFRLLHISADVNMRPRSALGTA